MDKRTIYFLSTLHPGNLPPGNSPPTVKRRLADGSQQEVVCPPLLPDYQAYMRGVDHGDQYISYYNVGRRSKMWWKRIFSYIIECATLNSFILDSNVQPAAHVQRGRAKRDLLAFKLELATDLIGTFSSRKRSGRPSSALHEQHERLNHSFGHWPQHV